MLNRDEIRQRLLGKIPQVIDRNDFRRAAVLVPVYWNDGEPHVVFTKRSEKVPHHKGQVSFPGGSIDASDADDFSAAVRETTEEIGIPEDRIKLLGRLDDIITVTHFVVSPFVAEIPAHFPYQPSEFEIAEIFDVPLRELADPARMREELVQFENRPYPIYYFDHKGHNIWGATAKILRQMLSLTGVMPGDVPSDSVLPSDL
jgi:8-oxo-dGTP pyrophosphatase MutT (NUDIX family)